jgi:esterase
MKLFHRDFGTPGRPPLAIIHGLLGSSRNWQTAARDLAAGFHVLALDLRNHGQSPHSEEDDFPSMVEDVLEWLDDQGLPEASILGHSLGGKVAMKLACVAPRRVRRLIIVDIAPRDYPVGSAELEAMMKLDLHGLALRRDAEVRLAADIPDLDTRRFLLTNLVRDRDGEFHWQGNLPILKARLPELRRSSLDDGDRFEGPSLFILGGRSRFVRNDDEPLIRRHFPHVEIVVLERSGHFPHVDDRPGFTAAVMGTLEGA